MTTTGSRRTASLAGCAALLMVVAGAHAQTAGREPVPGQPLGAGATHIDVDHPVTSSGELRVWRVASSEGARVMLKVFRPDGDRLLLVGTSPLETAAPGGVSTFECQIPVARNDLIGCYCPDSSCVDGFTDGQTLTVEGDRGTGPTADFASGTGSPAIFGSGWRLADVPSTAGTDLVVPAIGRTAGAAGTLWRTSLEIFNTAESSTSVALYLNLSDVDNTTPAASGQVSVEPRGILVIEDLVADIFEMADAVGSVDIVASAPVIAHARIANLGSEAGTFGQAVPAVPASWAVGADAVPGIETASNLVYLFEALDDGQFRSNLGVASTVATVLSVEAVARIGADPVGSPLQLELEPFSHTQVNRVLDAMGVPRGARGVRLELSAAADTGGRFLAYLSRVDNESGDAVFLLGERQDARP